MTDVGKVEILAGMLLESLSRFEMSRARTPGKPAFLAFLPALLIVALAACDRSASSVQDHAADALGLPSPRQVAVATSNEASMLPAAAARRQRWQRAFFARDFGALDAELNEAHRRYVAGAVPRGEPIRWVELIADTGLAGMDACDEWVGRMPESYAAHWTCGRVWESGAWQARSEKVARKVSDAKLALMRLRLARSEALLARAVTLAPMPVQARARLAANLFLQGRHRDAQVEVDKAWAELPTDPDAYIVAANFAQPKWGGRADDVAAVIERARKSGVHADHVTFMHDHYVAQPWRDATPGAERAYWESALREHPTFDRMNRLLRHLLWVKNWRDALPVADRLIAAHPDRGEPYHWRAQAREALGQAQGALDDYRIGAAMGDDAAVQALILAHLQGSLGLPAKDLDALARVCASGTALGTAAGANCIAASHWDGSLPAIARDPSQALAWHLAASRAGHFNSQHDLGWLLYSGKAAGVAQGDLREAGLFWLRRAAENGHVYAQRRLEEAGEPLAEDAGSSHRWMRWLGPGLAGAVATLVVGWLMRAGHTPAPRQGTLRLMTYGVGMRIAAVVMLAGAAFVSYAAWHARPSQFAVAMVVATCFIAGALFVFYQVFAVRIAWDEQALTYRTPLAGTRRIPWHEVQEIGYSAFMQCHYLRCARGGRIWISGMLRGFEELGEFLARRNAPPETR